MGSGLVYAAVGLVWVWYIGTRVHQVREDHRPAADVSGAPGRVVRRAAAEPESPALVADPAVPGGSVAVVEPAPRLDPVVTPALTPVRRAARRATVRRRRVVLVVLLVLSVVLGGITALGLLPAAAAVPAPVLAVAYVAAVSRRRSRALPAADNGAPVSAVAAGADDPSWVGVPYVGVVADWCRDGEQTDTTCTTGAAAEEPAAGAESDLDLADPAPIPRVAAPAPGSWRAVPVPLPTYVTAPRVARTVSTIDLGSTGAWTSGRMTPPPLALPTGEPPAARTSTEAVAADQAELGSSVADESTEALEVPRAAAG